MIPQIPELLLIILIVLVVFGLGKLPKISKGLARLRLNFEKGVAEDYIEVGSSDDEIVEESNEQESSETRGA